tara:strand:+ start:42 stop:626 length:585 start_codon:yes stop_codon:yes gene_type:complete
MTLEELRKQDESDENKDEDEDDTKKSSNERSFDEALIETLSTLTEHVKALSDSQFELEERIEKALYEEPKTQLDLTPSGTADAEDVGADVTVPDTFQSNSVQAGLDDDKSGQDKPLGDKGGLAMQQKANFDFTTETPRPSASVENINKSADVELNMVLKDARSNGYEGLSHVAKRILAGDYGSPETTQQNGGYY